MDMRCRPEQGLTLLELLVVLVVLVMLGLLAGIVAPKYFNQLGRSETKLARAHPRRPVAVPRPATTALTYYAFSAGDVAQLGERGVRNAEVGSSILLVSTRTRSPRGCATFGGLSFQAWP